MSLKPKKQKNLHRKKMVTFSFSGLKEISGFGGSYEASCRKMFKAGMNFISTCKNFNPEAQEIKNVFGIISAKNQDAENLIDAIANAEDGCSGAQVHAVYSHCIFAWKNGISAYKEKMKK